MALSAAIKAELAKPGGRLIPLLEVDWPTGTKRYARHGVASLTLGSYKSKVRSFGSVTWSAMDRAGALQNWTLSPSIADEDFELANLVGSGYELLNTPARVKLAHPSVAAASWATICSGVLSSPSSDGDMVWTLPIVPNDLALRGPLCRTFFDANVFDNLPNAYRGKRVPLIGGYHNGAGDTEADGGRVTLIPVTNANPSKHIVCKGPVTLLRVFSGATRLGTAAWTASYPILGGVTYTMVTMGTNRYAETITADVLGYAAGQATNVAPNLSTFTVAPGKLLKHLLVNHAYNQWERAVYPYDWFADASAPIDAAAFDSVDALLAHQANGNAYTWGYNLTGEETGLAVTGDWAAQMGARLFWTIEGKLSCSLNRANGRTLTVARALKRGEIATLVNGLPAADAVSRVQATFNGGKDSVDAFAAESAANKTEAVAIDLDFL